ncbi:MAG: helix-turn-helix transcriptional regulator, partial [Candidatus Marinimicrobia bacterium]|nr:helix-turn-helix transcriptional regulator [Candidatus Neomarinimicrobiota bacterium]
MDFDFGNHVDNPVQLRRLRAGFTQKELAAKLGVTQAYVSKLERAQ